MRYEEHPPPAPIAACVACLWTLTGSATSATFDLILPDGRPELVVHRGDPFRQRLGSGATRRQPRRLVVGQMTGAVALAPGRHVESIGVRFTPAGLSPLCPFPQAALADRLVSVDAVPRAPLLQVLAAAAADAPTAAAALDALRQALVGVYATTTPVDPRLQRAVVAIAQSGGDVGMDVIAGEVGVSSRWLERHFTAAVGVTPKRLARLVRFRRALAALDANPANGGVAVALDHGYYDQAHFIAEFRAFAGDAPRRIVDHRLAALTRFFVDRGAAP